MRTLLIFLLTSAICSAQNIDTTTPPAAKFSEIRVTGAHFYQSGLSGSVWGTQYQLPESIRNERQEHSGGTIRDNYIRDNPLYHGATCLTVEGTFRPVAGITLFSWLTAEHRGASYGVFDLKSMIFLPQIKAMLDTSVTILDQSFRIGISVGNERNLRLYEGLTVFNMETQGSELFVQWRNFRLTRRHIGDALYGYGLNIGDIVDYFVSAEELKFSDDWKADIRLGTSDYGRENDDNYTGSLGVYTPNIRVYGQYAVRKSENASTGTALLVGCSGEFNTPDDEKRTLHITGHAEYRQFDAMFNRGYFDPYTLGRFRSNSAIFPSSTTGRYLYPLYLFRRPFAQWAAFTEYQGRSVECLALTADVSYNVFSSFVVFGGVDINAVSASGEPTFTYPFCEVGFGWEPKRETRLSASVSNKGIDLDTHYPGHFISTITL